MINNTEIDLWITQWRSFFPFFINNPQVVYLDNSGTSLKPFALIKGVNKYYEELSVNTHTVGSHSLLKTTQQEIFLTRRLIANKIGVKNPKEIVFMPSTTYALNILTLSLSNYLKKNDQIALTYLEHSSNCYPFEYLAKKCQAITMFLPLNKQGMIDIDQLDKYINHKTKIVSFAHINNNLGVTQPIYSITAKIKKINPNCLIIIDACQSISHIPILVDEWSIDALVFSTHKMYGPTGLSILWVGKIMTDYLDKTFWGGGNKIGPYSYSNENKSKKDLTTSLLEVGTLPLAQIFGFKSVLEWLNKLNFSRIEFYEKKITKYAFLKLFELTKIVIYTNKNETTNIILFNLIDYHAHDVVDYLGKNNIIVRAGDFCCPYLEKAIGTQTAIRISLAFYNTKQDIDKLVMNLKKIIANPELLLEF